LWRRENDFVRGLLAYLSTHMPNDVAGFWRISLTDKHSVIAVANWRLSVFQIRNFHSHCTGRRFNGKSYSNLFARQPAPVMPQSNASLVEYAPPLGAALEDALFHYQLCRNLLGEQAYSPATARRRFSHPFGGNLAHASVRHHPGCIRAPR